MVAEHTYSYDPNGNKTRDAAAKMNADTGTLLNTTSVWDYDPLDRIAQLTKTGTVNATETYVHDANNNVISQTVKNATTDFTYDRNRLLSSSTAGVAAAYNYDPFGRLDTITSDGTVIERNTYDGFDHVVENQKLNSTGGLTSTKYTFDPLDRTTSKTTGAGTTEAKTTDYAYLGLSDEVLTEAVADKLTKTFQYSPWGERLSQTKINDDGSHENGFYGYNDHTDVETLTGDNGDTKATYGYTAYGDAEDAETTGLDKPDPADPTKEAYNPYRYNSKRWDPASEKYDMGFRDYDPGLNRFTVRDTYTGALDDLGLGADPFTGNRYAFGAGNPVGNIEYDGHTKCDAGVCPTPEQSRCAPAQGGCTDTDGDRRPNIMGRDGRTPGPNIGPTIQARQLLPRRVDVVRPSTLRTGANRNDEGAGPPVERVIPWSTGSVSRRWWVCWRLWRDAPARWAEGRARSRPPGRPPG